MSRERMSAVEIGFEEKNAGQRAAQTNSNGNGYVDKNDGFGAVWLVGNGDNQKCLSTHTARYDAAGAIGERLLTSRRKKKTECHTTSRDTRQG